MRRYTLYCPQWIKIATIEVEGINDAIGIANAHYPRYKFISVDRRY